MTDNWFLISDYDYETHKLHVHVYELERDSKLVSTI